MLRFGWWLWCAPASDLVTSVGNEVYLPVAVRQLCGIQMYGGRAGKANSESTLPVDMEGSSANELTFRGSFDGQVLALPSGLRKRGETQKERKQRSW